MNQPSLLSLYLDWKACIPANRLRKYIRIEMRCRMAGNGYNGKVDFHG